MTALPEWVTHEFLVASANRTRAKLAARATGTAFAEQTLVEEIIEWWEREGRPRWLRTRAS